MGMEWDIPDYVKTDGYAKVGGPPKDWYMYDVIDMDTGRKLEEVIEVDCHAGWLIRYKTDKNGEVVMDERGNLERERIEGHFGIEDDRERVVWDTWKG